MHRILVIKHFAIISIFLNVGVSQAATIGEQLWDGYDKMLSEYVSVGKRQGIVANLVDYDGLANSAEFSSLVKKVKDFPVDKLVSKHDKLAYYINLYNILTIQLILDHKPEESIKEVGSFFSGPWDQVVLKSESGNLTLNNIEHDIIRPLGDPRIHFAVNCASLSCPDIRKEAYRSAKLDFQLDEQSIIFLNQVDKGYREEKGESFLSSIFKWYGGDFEDKGGVSGFIKSYLMKANIKEQSYMKYNWSLNKR